MESNLEISNINTIHNPPPQDDVEHEPEQKPKPKQIITQKRKNGPMQALRVALLRMRGSPKKSSVTPIDDESKNGWKKIVGSIRPLHLHSNQSPRSSPRSNNKKFDNVTTLPPTSPSESCSGGTTFSDFPVEEEPFSPSPESPPNSRYASAIGLNELVQSDDENDRQDSIKEECQENGDEKIDAKAEEFIAQFYQQMRLQRLNNVDRDYQERSQRSLGW